MTNAEPTIEHQTSAGALPELPKQYRPADHEQGIFQRWLDCGAFDADPNRVVSGEAKPFAVLIPPPNVTARLHLGHALNNTLQDVLVRSHRMKGYEAMWMPGTDHAGIATQTVVEKRLMQEEGKRRTEYAREDFVARVQAFKDDYEGQITDQLRRLGASCDWKRQRFTMDTVCARAVREAFYRLFKDGLIYRGKRLVNWDPVTQTALADDEVDMIDVDGFFWYLRYPVVDDKGNATGEYVTVATTRPETMLGDTAVAVNPTDGERAMFIGKRVKLPIVNRIIPIIGDDYVVKPDPESSDNKAKYASGFLKVTPAHDPNDWQIGQRHSLDAINVMAPNGSISNQHGWPEEDFAQAETFASHLLNMDRYEAREAIVAWFREKSLLEASKPYTHAVGHSYRSHVPVEPYLSDQWYVKVTDDALVGAAQRALHNEGLTFHPDRYAHSYSAWHENLRDWCISRQLWWGHQIPVWHKRIEANDVAAFADVEPLINRTVQGASIQVVSAATGDHVDHADAADALAITDIDVYLCLEDTVHTAQWEAIGFERDPDVLDTWFSSALWPMSTMGWPDAELAARDTGITDFPAMLRAFNPTSVLSTGRDIITLWVSRMVMFNRYLLAEMDNAQPGDGRLPFRDVFIHPTVQDGQGQKMSKSLGNGVDPLDVVETHGADALRLTMCQIATQTQDVRMPLEIICPHTGKMFEPKMTTTPNGHRVTAPVQDSPFEPGKQMVTLYGVVSGLAKPTEDMPLASCSSPRFDAARNFCTKLWNATKFAMMMLGEVERTTHKTPVDPADMSFIDKWMLSKLAKAVKEIDNAISEYQFAHYSQVAYDLLWRDFCDWYIEAIKPTLKSDSRQQAVLAHTLESILRVLHPLIPFVTETIWGVWKHVETRQIDGVSLPAPRKGGMLCTAGWPEIDDVCISDDAEQTFEELRTLVSAIREVRAEQQVKPRQKITFHPNAALAAKLDADGDFSRALCTLAGIGEITTADPKSRSIPLVIGSDEHALSDLSDAVDASAEREQFAKRIEELTKSEKALAGRLSNPGYVDKAPEHLVNQTREQLERTREEIRTLTQAMEQLG
ncbi:MAG: valine--tRNA ligase [Phycisphaeraceae bacterium]|nr:valine--tRNA ligase [Phycisphaerales bacterium]MCB9859194.1 valine--tRNA ligase [Phycisphaeraceae bacterium]